MSFHRLEANANRALEIITGRCKQLREVCIWSEGSDQLCPVLDAVILKAGVVS
jgi:hypothetical protein